MAEYTALAMAPRTSTTLAGLPVQPFNTRHVIITMDVLEAPGRGGLTFEVVAPNKPLSEDYRLITVMRDARLITRPGLYQYVMGPPDDRYDYPPPRRIPKNGWSVRWMRWTGAIPQWWTIRVVAEDDSPYLYGVTFDMEEVSRV